MVRILGIASLALAVVSSVSGHVIRHRGPPKGWETAILESYDVYHARYLDLKCYDKHNTTYFDKCCHPLLKDESLSVLYDLNCFSSDNEDCDDGSSSVPHSAHHSPAAMAPSPKPDTPTSSPPAPTTSSHEQQDKPYSSPPEQTTPSPEPSKPVVHTSAQPTTTSPSSSGSNSGNDDGDWITDGFATFFYQNGIAGACGTVHSDSDFIAAIASGRYGNTGAKSPLCGKKVEIVNPANGKSVTVTIEDACPTCNNRDSIDLSKAAFLALAAESVGLFKMKWHFV